MKLKYSPAILLLLPIMIIQSCDSRKPDTGSSSSDTFSFTVSEQLRITKSPESVQPSKVIKIGISPTDTLVLEEFVTDLSSSAVLPTKTGDGIAAEPMASFDVDAYRLSSGAKYFSDSADAPSSGDVWETSSSHTWESGEGYEFWCRSGINLSLASTCPSSLSFNYTTTSSNLGTDVLFSKEAQAEFSSEHPVGLVFTHALSAVRFSFADMPSYYDSPSVSLNAGSTGSCVYDGSGFTWSSISGSASFAISSASNAFQYFIPQTLSGDNGFTISLTDYDSSSSVVLNSGPSDISWEPGKLYTYRASFSTSVRATSSVSANVLSNPTITNTGATKVFVRAAIVGNWVLDGDVVSPWSATVQGVFAGLMGSGWTKYSVDGFYYYADPVLPQDNPTALFTSYTLDSALMTDPPVPGATLDIDIVVQCIEYDSAKQNFANAWGVAYSTLFP